MHRLLSGALLGCVLHARVPQLPPHPSPVPLTFDTLLARASPDLQRLRAEAEHAGRQHQLAATGGILREGPTLSIEAGPRRSPAHSSTDRAAQVEAPLLLAPRLRSVAQSSLDQSRKSSREYIQAEVGLRLRLAYLDAWLSQVQVDLRRRQAETTRRWLDVATTRVASGADPAFQRDLVRGDLLRTATEEADALRRQAEAWSSLRALVDLPPTPLPLAAPEDAPLPDPGVLASAFEASLARRALAERIAADRASADLLLAARSARWSLKGSHAVEGEDRVTRLGIAFRLPRAGEDSARRGEAAALRALQAKEAEVAEVQLQSRFQSALGRLASLHGQPVQEGFSEALRAVDLRLREGKERPSDALILQRQLLDGELARLQNLRDRLAVVAELDLLTHGAAR